MENPRSITQKSIIEAALARYREGASPEEEQKILITSMERYQAEIRNKGGNMPYNALVLRYFADNPQSFVQIAVRLFCTKRAVFKYLASGVFYLAPHLLGIEGLYIIPPDNRNSEHEEKGRQYANTKRILENYRTLVEFTKRAGLDAGAEEDPIEIIDGTDDFVLKDEPLNIKTIMQSQQRTLAVLNHIDKAISEFKTSCKEAGKEEAFRRYRVIQTYFLGKGYLPLDKIMEQEQVKRRTVYRDIQNGIGQLTCRIYTPHWQAQDKKGGEGNDVFSNCAIPKRGTSKVYRTAETSAGASAAARGGNSR